MIRCMVGLALMSMMGINGFGAEGKALSSAVQINEEKIVNVAKAAVEETFKVPQKDLHLRLLMYRKGVDPKAYNYAKATMEVWLYDRKTILNKDGATIFIAKFNLNDFPKSSNVKKYVRQTFQIPKTLVDVPLRKGNGKDLVAIDLDAIIDAHFQWKHKQSHLTPVKGKFWPASFTYTLIGDGRTANFGKIRECEVYSIILEKAVVGDSKKDKTAAYMGKEAVLAKLCAETLEMTSVFGYNWYVHFPQKEKAFYENLIEKATSGKLSTAPKPRDASN